MVSKEKAVSETLHGVKIVDAYRWLEDSDSKRTQQFVERQNERAREILNKLPFREEIRDRVIALNEKRIHHISVVRKNPETGLYRYFQMKQEPGQKFPVFYRRDGLDGEEKVAIDPNKFSEDGSISLFNIYVSKDGKKIAYSTSKDGSDRVTFYVLDLESGKLLKDVIPSVRYSSVAWLNDGSGFYYTTWPEPGVKSDVEYTHLIYLHKLGNNFKEDTPVFGKDLPTDVYFGVDIESGSKYLTIDKMLGFEKNEVYYKNIETGSDIRPLIVGKDAKFYAAIIGESAYVITDYKAPKWRVIKIDVNKPEESAWREIVPQGKDILEDFRIIDNKLCLRYLSDVHSRIFVCDLEGKHLKEVRLPGLGTASNFGGALDSKDMFFMFESFTNPGVHYKFDLEKMKLAELEKNNVGVDTGKFETKQVWYKSRDGTEIPMFIVSQKGVQLDGKNPVVLSGYGGFGLSYLPDFSASIITVLEHGGVYAIANLRGGGEFGEDWHRAGMMAKKQNVFDDFISAAEWLISNKYTNRDKLGIVGGSNGGLLVAACMVQRPDLFKAVVCSAPLLDMLRYHKIAGGPVWITEYGNPEKESEFRFLLRYSPYHNVKKEQQYPAVLFMSADNDTRVGPMHARKMAAEMIDYNKDNLVLLRTQPKMGHGFGMSINVAAEETADMYAFLFWQLGIKS